MNAIGSPADGLLMSTMPAVSTGVADVECGCCCVVFGGWGAALKGGIPWESILQGEKM